MQDTTKIANDKLQELELLASIARSADNSILILSESGDIQWANKGFSHLYGYTLDEYKKKKSDDSSSFIKVIRDTDRNFFKKNSSFSFSRIISTPTGQKKWIQSTLTPVKKHDDNVERFIVIEFDITQQKEVEEELKQRWENTQTLTEHLESVKDYVEEQITELNEQKKALEIAKERSEEVLNKVIPYEVAIQLKKKGYAAPRHYKKVTLLHLNIRNFFKLSEHIPIEELVTQLHESLVKFDTILEKHFVEKIKTVGGVYLGAGGVPLRNKSNPIDVVLAALEIDEKLQRINTRRIKLKLPIFEYAIGIHTGKVIAGVVGKNKLSYDVWGDTVTIAHAIEGIIEQGSICLSESTLQEIETYFNCIEKGTVSMGATDELKLYELKGIVAEYAKDAKGIHPNTKFMHLLSKL
ncbi:MAG: adenylate/guanylate cyclase domain-containing protein [Salinivirgaceae bacterium]